MWIQVFEILFFLVMVSLVSFSFVQKRNKYKPRINFVVLKVPRVYAFLIGGLVLFLCIFAFIVVVSSKDLFSEIGACFGVIAILSFLVYLWLEWYSISWRLEFCKSEDFFDYRNFFFKKKRMRFSDFSFYRITSGGIDMKNQEHRIYVDNRAENYQAFVDILKQNHIYQDKTSN